MAFKLPKNSVEFVCALTMIGSGVYLSGTGTSGSAVVVIGNLLSALGGALISWATVKLTSTEAAADLLRPQLSAIARQLVSVSGQISNTVQNAQSGALDHSVALENISQASRIMYSSVNEIHVVLNEEVQIKELLSTAQRVNDLATKLGENSTVTSEKDKNEFKDALSELKVQLQEITISPNKTKPNKKQKPIPKAAPHELQAVVVECPKCNQNVPTKIGPAPGSSANPLCESCNLQFHAHRLKDGTVDTKTPRSNNPQP